LLERAEYICHKNYIVGMSSGLSIQCIRTSCVHSLATPLLRRGTNTGARSLEVSQFEIRVNSLQLAACEYDHLFDEPGGSRGERLAVGGHLIGNQGDLLVPFSSDECKNM
jgi:hypothetical protein